MKFAAGWWVPTDTDEQQHPVLRREKKSAVIERAIKHHSGRRVAIQAGAHCGLWPIRLAAHYSHVCAFEADRSNYECAVENTQESNVTLVHAALGDRNDDVGLVRTEQSTGMHHIAVETELCKDSVGMLTIDQVGISDIDAIFLDIEGCELAALKGAAAAIEAYHPLIVCEENACGERYGVRKGDIGRWLSAYGYRQVDRYSQDLIFAC